MRTRNPRHQIIIPAQLRLTLLKLEHEPPASSHPEGNACTINCDTRTIGWPGSQLLRHSSEFLPCAREQIKLRKSATPLSHFWIQPTRVGSPGSTGLATKNPKGKSVSVSYHRPIHETEDNSPHGNHNGMVLSYSIQHPLGIRLRTPWLIAYRQRQADEVQVFYTNLPHIEYKNLFTTTYHPKPTGKQKYLTER